MPGTGPGERARPRGDVVARWSAARHRRTMGELAEGGEEGTPPKDAAGTPAPGLSSGARRRSGREPGRPTRSRTGGRTTATLYDVARLAGVSTATVSRVLHGHDRVSATTRDKVQAVIDQLGYVPDSAAQSLSRRRKEIIGLVTLERRSHQADVEGMSLLFYDEVLHGVESRLRDQGWSLLISCFAAEDEGGYRRLQDLSGKVDGLIIGEGIVQSQMLARLAERVPVVVIAGNPDEHAVDVIAADNRSGSTALATHLIEEHGRRRFYAIDGPASAPDARERRAALDKVLASCTDVELVGSYAGVFSVQSGEQAAERLLADHAGALPDAVVCANDQMAIGVLQAFAHAGVRVPDQVSVVGFDDIYPGSLYEPALTTVHQPMRELGARACDRLLRRLA
ncbi:MAG TPA: LacI family DNA-binding transcriptional regulator, partial [Acidimicrobiales bacterium]|nr:LacI family DNA-binding transcriptional regulator [Acidimicrobiales bacterium]